ncbi:MAG: Regulator of RpoS [Phycisphaerae bacterium]|nr:Regulator of RpoS [Phycisphaerae bacterium]
MNSPLILIADDDPMLVRVLSVRCQHLGCAIETAAEGREVIIRIHQHRPDLIIMDLDMPNSSGLNIYEMLAADMRWRTIPVIILSGQRDNRSRARAEELGARWVTKSPDCWAEIREYIQQVLQLSGSGCYKSQTGEQLVDEPAGKSADARPLILVVDDDQAVSRAIDIRLEANGYHAVCARSGAQALFLAQERKPALITLDLGLPEIDGLQLLRSLRDDPATQSIPVIVLTGNTQTQVREEFQRLGVAAFMTKPFSTRDVLRRIEEILGMADLTVQKGKLS